MKGGGRKVRIRSRISGGRVVGWRKQGEVEVELWVFGDDIIEVA